MGSTGSRTSPGGLPGVARRCGCSSWVKLLAVALVTVLPTRAADPPGGPDMSAPEARLWQRIETLTRPTPMTGPRTDWFQTVEQRRVILLDRLKLYQTLYPGGAHRDDAIRLELTARFELAALRDGSLGDLDARVQGILRDPPSAAAAAEAAYWAIQCRRWQRLAASTQPASTTVTDPDPDLLAEYRLYVQRYPHSRHAPRLATLLFEDAARRDDRAAMQELLAGLRRHFPDLAATRSLEAEWRRTSAVGQPFWPRLTDGEGSPLEQADYLGHPVLLVVWAASDPFARHCVRQIELFRKAHSDLRVIGIGLDESRAQTMAAARELSIAWPQFNDGLGWGGEFVRAWGIRRTPHVFAIDRSGRLAGTATDDSWEALAQRVLGAEADAPRR